MDAIRHLWNRMCLFLQKKSARYWIIAGAGCEVVFLLWIFRNDLISFWSSVLPFLQSMVNVYGIIVIAISLAFDEMGVPLPSTALIVSFTVIAKTLGEFPWALVWIALFIPPIGNGILFFFGKMYGKKWLQNHGHKYPRIRAFLSEENLEMARKKFLHFGEDAAILICSMFTTVRPFMAFVAGTMNIAAPRFICFNFLGASVWAGTVMGVAYFGKDIWGLIKFGWSYLAAFI